MTKFIITRHGQTEWNVEMRMQGQSNSPLTPLGRQQAVALGKRLSDTEIHAVYSSSLQRTLDTTEIVCKGRNLRITPLDSLREIALGSWSGQLLADVEKAYPEKVESFWKHPESYEPMPGGETYIELRKRASNALKEMACNHRNETILVVAHGIVLKALYNYFRNQPISDIGGNNPHPKSCCYCEVEWKDGVWYINKWNDTTHYELIPDQYK